MSDRRGVAIVLVLVLILGGGALAHGVLLAARAELAAARARADRVERAAAERVALQRAIWAGDVSDARDLGTWSLWLVPGSGIGDTVGLRRIGHESWWASGAGSRARRPGSPGRLLWWLDPVARVEALDGVVSVGANASVVVDGDMDVTGWGTAEPPLTTAVCDAEIGWAFGDGPPAVALLDSGVVRPHLGLLDLDVLLERTSLTVDVAGTPAPVETAGQCVVDDAWNWGDPERPSRPCGTHLVVRAATSSLRVSGGVGQGAWAIDGDMVLEEGARLHGIILASGALVLEDGAAFHGAAVAIGGLRAAAGTRLSGSACWAARALRAAAPVWAPRPDTVPGVPAITP